MKTQSSGKYIPSMVKKQRFKVLILPNILNNSEVAKYLSPISSVCKLLYPSNISKRLDMDGETIKNGMFFMDAHNSSVK
jgi:hypothetical protein